MSFPFPRIEVTVCTNISSSKKIDGFQISVFVLYGGSDKMTWRYAVEFEIEIQFSFNLSFIRSIMAIDILLFINMIWELKNDLSLFILYGSYDN
jgi:hypothetical protein